MYPFSSTSPSLLPFQFFLCYNRLSHGGERDSCFCRRDSSSSCNESRSLQAGACPHEGLSFLPRSSYYLWVCFEIMLYVAVYFSILFLRYRAGIVTKEMLSLPKVHFVVIGVLEALGVASGMSAGAMLPGPAIPILSQSFLVWQIIFSILFLRKSYSLNQLLGCFLVISGVIIAVTSGSDEGRFLSNVEFIWPVMMIGSSALQAGASILKEFIFIDGERRLKGKRPDIFVVNSFGSAFQALFVFLLLPFLSNLKGIQFGDLPEYINEGASCFLNTGDDQIACDGAPFLPLLFITVNMTFNISLLNLVKMSSALVASLTTALAVPISIYVLSLPLPYMPHGSRLSTSFVLGASVLLLGLILYNLPKPAKQRKNE